MSRGITFAAIALALGTGAHVIGGGSAPGPLAVALLAIPVAWVSMFLTLRRRSAVTIIGSLVLVQAGLHEGLHLLSAPMAATGASTVPNPSGAVMAGHGSGMREAVLAGSSGETTAMAPSLGMLAVHLVAATITGMVLAYGDQLLWSLWSWLRRSLVVLGSAIRVPAYPQGLPAWGRTGNPVPAPVSRCVRRRGPPVDRSRLTLTA